MQTLDPAALGYVDADALDALAVTCAGPDWDACARDAATLKASAEGRPAAVRAQFFAGKALWGQGANVQAADALEAFADAHAGTEDYAEALLQLFDRCRSVVAKPVSQQD